MPYKPYKELKTGNEVEAIQCEHSGMIIQVGGFDHFDEKDWIVRYPENMLGERNEKVIFARDFPSSFLSLEDKKQFWLERGWKTS